ncbi:unnamed protein product, partial [Ixodes pacificus]
MQSRESRSRDARQTADRHNRRVASSEQSLVDAAMSHQVALLGKRLPAHPADVWTPVRVLSHVPDELVCSREPLPTHFAPERPLARVPPLVLHQGCLLREGAATHLAPKRLLPRVDPFVPGYVGSVAGVGAEATLVLASFPPV